ncbi:hypothetical protein [Ulvibacterium sp.]|uniref:hypothetical protein n=1 Tax=Ulvibacterium sp. TaxID=2665914 RepID=UPI003BAB860D
MEKLAFDLVANKKKSKYDIAISEKFFYIGLGGLIFLLAVFKVFEHHWGITLEDFPVVKYMIYGLMICIMIGTFYGLVDYNGNNRVIKGIITFDENEITLNHIERFELSEIGNLKFSLNDYKGRPINLITDGDPNRSYGGDNFVEFNYRNKTHKYQFVIDSLRHKALLVDKTIPKMRDKTKINY